MISVEAIGLLSDGSVALHRLYLPGRESLFQLHLGPAGTPDECRYFSQIDEVTPASQEEWGFWLDPAQGLIGWPQFQTKDGKTYGRVWAPGGGRIEPRQQTETVQDVKRHGQPDGDGDAVWRADRRRVARAGYRVHPRLGDQRRRPGVGGNPCRHRRQPGGAHAARGPLRVLNGSMP